MKKNVVKSNDELALQEEGKVVATTTDANDADQKLPPDEEGKDEENCGGDNDEDEKIPISFDWPVYVDATLAGLSVLIPVPFVDNIMEIVFARRMIGAIAQRRKVELSAQRISMVNNRLTCCGMILACFYFPIFVILELVISLFRILVYCWTIKKSTDALTYYWQRAFLMDYMLQRGYVSTKDPDQAEAAIVCMERLLDEVAQSPLTRLARKIIYAPCRIGFSIMWYMCCCCCCCCCGGKNGGKDGSIGQAEATMSESWTNFGAYLTSLAERYEDEFAKSQRPRGNGMMIRRFCCP